MTIIKTCKSRKRPVVVMCDDVEKIVFMTTDHMAVGVCCRDPNGEPILKGHTLDKGPRIVEIHYRK